MTTSLLSGVAPGKAVRKAQSPAGAQGRPARAVAPPATVASGVMAYNASDRKEMLSTVGKEIASSMGAYVLQKMLARSRKTMRQLARESGFDVSALSNIANGKRLSGPELWTLVALAEAMNFDLRLDFSER